MAHRKPGNEEMRLSGTVASDGLVSGAAVFLDGRKETVCRSAPGTPEQEKETLGKAVTAACHDLETLLQRLDDEEAAGLVEFQIAMLEDETVLEPAYAAILSGQAAAIAWDAAMGTLISDYETAESDYFQARASDLADIRDRVVRHIGGVADNHIPPGSVMIGDDLAPTLFLETDWSGSAIVLHAGSPSSHVAMLARARAVPMLVAVERLSHEQTGIAMVDTQNGCVVLNPGPDTLGEFKRRQEVAKATAAAHSKFLHKPAQTADGTQIEVHLNISQPEELDALDPTCCDGIGLVRTEFLFHGKTLPDEAAQFACYARIVKWAQGRPVTIRTLDAGGDKPIAGLTENGESNPFLGVRGFRLSRRHPEIFKIQLRALLRVSALGPLKIMLPMISVPEEMDVARQLLGHARAELDARGENYGNPELGMMVEVPAAAICIKEFDADFYSVGSNDLLQYVMACGRDNPNLGDIMDGHASALSELLARIAGHSRASNRQASICGDLAGNPESLPILLDSGMRSLSVSPAALARIKAAIAGFGGRADA